MGKWGTCYSDKRGWMSYTGTEHRRTVPYLKRWSPLRSRWVIMIEAKRSKHSQYLKRSWSNEPYKFRGLWWYLHTQRGCRCTSGSREGLYNLPTDTALIGTYSHATIAVRDVAECAISFTCPWGEDITDNKPAWYSLVMECKYVGVEKCPRG